VKERDVSLLRSQATVISILHEQLDIKKLSARWVPRLLTVDHKRDRITISKQYLEMFRRNSEFLHRFITVDETWIYHFTPEMKESKQWTSPREPASKKAKIVKAGKVMAIVFWDARGIIHIDFLPSKQTINYAGDYYAALLDVSITF